jgi:hypothetical protein
MLWRLIIPLLATAAVHAAIWPEHLGPYTRKWAGFAGTPHVGPETTDEYGLQDIEAADYGTFKATAAQFKDSTGAYAAALEHPSIQVGNYVITCAGNCPKDLPALAETLPHVSHGPLPELHTYFREKGIVPHSQRYVLGPIGLKAFAPEIPPGPVAFQFGTEGEIARYRTSKGEETLAIFSYPTPQMARQQVVEFQKLPGAVVKRSGPLLAVVPSPRDSQGAERLLSQLSWQASVSLDERPPMVIKPQSLAKMILAILTLAGIILAFCVLSGLAFGVSRIVLRKFGISGADGPMILLNLRDK